MKPFWMLLTAAILSVAARAEVNPDDLLPAAEAFKPAIVKTAEKSVTVRYKIADHYYLYRDHFKFALLPGDKAIKPVFPAGEVKQDPNFGDVTIYHHQVDVVLNSDSAFAPGTKLKITAQGCAEAGVCYPPETVTFPITVKAAATAPTVSKSPDVSPPPAVVDAAPPVATDHAAAKAVVAELAQPAALAATPTTVIAASPNDGSALFKSGSLLALLTFFFAAGLGLAFTACMYPLIPIISGIVVGQGSAVSKARSFALSVVYVQGMAVTYAVAGVAAALSGTLLSSALQNGWVLGAFALFFVVMSLSMFGLFELQLPGSLQSRLNDASNKLPGGRWLPVFGMGALSALIVGPCVAPPLAAALGYIGASGDVVRGGLALYVMALGIGLPLIVVGVVGGHALPKAGGWMTMVKNAFGTLMLALALWIARPVLPDWAFMLGIALLLIGSGVALSAIDSLVPHVKPHKRLEKAVGLVLLLVGIAQLIGLLAGVRDPLQPLKPFAGGGVAQAAEVRLSFKPVNSVAELDAAIAAAAGKPVMLDFYADWCVSCKEMERFTFSDARVQAKLAGVVLLKADVTSNTDEQKALLKRFGLFGPPGTIFFGKGGKEVGQRLIGFEEADAFTKRLGAING